MPGGSEFIATDEGSLNPSHQITRQYIMTPSRVNNSIGTVGPEGLTVPYDLEYTRTVFSPFFQIRRDLLCFNV